MYVAYKEMTSLEDIVALGNRAAIRKLIDNEKYSPGELLRQSVKSGNISSISYLCCQLNVNSINIHMYVCNISILLHHNHVVEWCVQQSSFPKLRRTNINKLLRTAILYENATSLSIMRTHKQFNVCLNEVFRDLARSGCVQGYQWLLEQEYRPSSFPKQVPEMIELYHMYNIPGAHQVKCREGTCIMCKQFILSDTWMMDTLHFDNIFQWLPREMMEDTLALTHIA